MAELPLLPPIGEAAPFIGLCLKPAAGASSAGRGAEGVLGEISKTAPLALLAEALAELLGVPGEAVVFMYEGSTLDLSLGLEQNRVDLPGPKRRREGAKVELLFDTAFEVMDAERRKVELERERELVQEVLEQEERQKREAALEAERRAARIEEELDEWVASHLGVDEGCYRQMLSDPEVQEPQHYLTACSEAVVASLQSLMRRSGEGCNFSVVRAYRNENQVLSERYRRARAALEGASIAAAESKTAGRARAGPEEFGFLGGFDAALNEYPMWHATPSADAAGGICGRGFDIAFAGSAHATAWGCGFYFAEKASISNNYAGHGVKVNEKYRHLKVMLLCQVLCGNLKQTDTAPSQEEKMRFTAECLGPGGTFGAKSAYHCILGGGWAYVCAHRDQVYPSYVILYHG